MCENVDVKVSSLAVIPPFVRAPRLSAEGSKNPRIRNPAHRENQTESNQIKPNFTANYFAASSRMRAPGSARHGVTEPEAGPASSLRPDKSGSARHGAAPQPRVRVNLWAVLCRDSVL
jgi:hypothetical protein